MLEDQPKPVIIKGNKLICSICKNNKFDERKTKIRTGYFSSHFTYGTADPAAIYYVCSKCGHMHWFFKKG